jgi:hypothetical protein
MDEEEGKGVVEIEPAVVCATTSFQSKVASTNPASQTQRKAKKRKAIQDSVSPSPIERAFASVLEADGDEEEEKKKRAAYESGEEEEGGRGGGRGGGGASGTSTTSTTPTTSTTSSVGSKEEGRRSSAGYKQPSRSKAAICAARVKAKKHGRMVEEGLCNPPKRNKPFRLNVKKLRMKKLGPFWYSRDPKSCYYMSFEDYQVVKEILDFYKDPKNMEKFHRARSNCNLRYYLNFHILHCKQSRVLGTLDPFMTDFANEYLANQRRYTRQWFCEFNRGPRMLVFEAPQYVQDELAIKEATYESCESSSSEEEEEEEEEEGGGKSGAAPVMLCVAARQLNYFHWIFTTNKYEIMCEREPKLHLTMNEYVKGHKERKSRLHLTTRQKLCVATPGPVIVDHTDTFTMKL